MATVTITIPDTLVPRITAAARATFPQYAALTDVAAFKRITADHWASILFSYEVGQARANADTQVGTTAAQVQTDAAAIG